MLTAFTSVVPEPSAFEVELAIEKLQSHRSPDTDQIQAQLSKAWGRTFRSEIHKVVVNFIWNKICLGSGKCRSLCQFIRRVIKQIVRIIEAYRFCQLRTKFYPTSCCQD